MPPVALTSSSATLTVCLIASAKVVWGSAPINCENAVKHWLLFSCFSLLLGSELQGSKALLYSLALLGPELWKSEGPIVFEGVILIILCTLIAYISAFPCVKNHQFCASGLAALGLHRERIHMTKRPHACSATYWWPNESLITSPYIVRSTPNFIGCTWASPRTHTYDQIYTCS